MPVPSLLTRLTPHGSEQQGWEHCRPRTTVSVLSPSPTVTLQMALGHRLTRLGRLRSIHRPKNHHPLAAAALVLEKVPGLGRTVDILSRDPPACDSRNVSAKRTSHEGCSMVEWKNAIPHARYGKLTDTGSIVLWDDYSRKHLPTRYHPWKVANMLLRKQW